MRRVLTAALLAAGAALSAQPAAPPRDPLPHDIDAFKAAAERVLQETGVPGAGIALVRPDRVEWEGGIGYADRDRRVPVTAATHFRAGSISKTFVALALVQLSEDGLLDLDAPVHEIAPDIVIDNPWDETDPVRVIHLLEHTAGFDDMHFNETYVPFGEPERTLEEVLQRNPASRRVRWPPGTRMAYSNPGYAVAALLLERVAAQAYEDYIAREIFEPLGMETSSFRLDEAAMQLLARGYRGPDGPPVGIRQIYLRPAGNLHTSAHELGRFVQMLLGWGERGDAYVVDPEFLGNMEYPQTTIASAAGLRNGYGSGIYTKLNLPYKVLGHDGGIDGFVSTYGYSPARDAGYVVLLNSSGGRAGEALQRLASLAIRFLKRDVAAPVPPEVAIDAEVLDQYTGYYHDANPRNQIAWPLEFLFSGQTVVRDGDTLFADPVFGSRIRLVPVSETMFRTEEEIDASRVFTYNAHGTMVLAGTSLYAERQPRWRVEMVRVPVFASLGLVASVLGLAGIWVARLRRARPRGFWELKCSMLLCPLALIGPAVGLALTPFEEWGSRNPGTTAVFVGTMAIPVLALVVGGLTIAALREGASRRLTTYSALVALAMGILSLYLSSHNLLGIRLWTY